MPYPGAGSASKACSAMSAEVGSHDSQVSCHVMYTDELTNPKHEKPYFASMLSGNLKWLCFGPRPLPGHTRHQELSFTVPSGLLVNQRNRSVIWSLKVTIPDSGFLRWSRSFPWLGVLACSSVSTYSRICTVSSIYGHHYEEGFSRKELQKCYTNECGNSRSVCVRALIS